MKILLYVLLFTNIIFAEKTKIYFYSTEIHIDNFKSFKVTCDNYIKTYGDYLFQPFNNKDIFESQIKIDNSILILSSWHYKELSKKYNLNALFVAQKKGTKTDTKVLIGKEESDINGLVTSAYDVSYTKKILSSFNKKESYNFPILIVPKEIDALMSVSFGMSSFALVSKDSLLFLKSVNPALTKNLKIINESEPKYRAILANNTSHRNEEQLVSMFSNISNHKDGRKILEIMNIENFVLLSQQDKIKLGDAK